MKKAGRILAGLFALCLSLYMGAADCMAAGSGQYTYTVTLHVGNHGEIRADAASYVQVVPPAEGAAAMTHAVEIKGDAIVVSGLAYNSQVTLQAQALVVSTNGKYYVKGARQSGRDDSEQLASCRVTGDRDFVTAYGVTGEQVSYTVRYEDEEGNALAESRVYYGNIGDRPVVAFRYIEGYEPQAYNLTKTLTANEAENIFTFVYRPVQAGGGTGSGTGGGGTGGGGGQTGEPAAPSGGQPAEGQGAVTPGTPAPGGAATPAPGGAVPPAPGGAAAPAPGGADAPAAPDEDPENDAPDDNQPGVDIPDEDVPTDDGPEELVDLDDEEVPLADIPGREEAAHGRRMTMVAIATGVVGAAALVGLFVLLWMQKKKKKEEA